MKKETEGEFQYRFGRMVKGVNSLTLKEDQISDSLNMVPGYQGWKQRKGMIELDTSAIASGLQFKKMIHFRDLSGNTNVILAHVYDSSNGERIMKQSTLPPSTHLGSTWVEMYDLTASCEDCQFGIVAGNLIAANDKEFLCWKGEQFYPTGVWKYINSATAYADYYDQMTDNDTTTVMDLDSFTTSDIVYIVSPMPLNKINFTIAAANSNISNMVVKKYNGSWTALTVTDGTATQVYTIFSDDFGDEDLDSMWTTGAGSSGSVAETANGLDIGSSDSDMNNGSYNPAFAYQTDVQGDFNVQVYLAGQGSNPNYAGEQAGILVKIDNDNWIYASLAYSSGKKIQWKHTTSDVSSASLSAAYSNYDVYIKVARVGTTFYGWYSDNGSDWTALVDPATPLASSANVSVGCFAADGGGSHFHTYFTNFVVNSGDQQDTTLAQTGSVTWTAATDEVKTIIEGVPGYAYQVMVDTALDSEVEISGISVHAPMDDVKAQWSGQYMIPTGCYVYDGSDHTDYTLYVGNTVESQYMDLSDVTTTDKIYVGFPFRTNRILFYPTSDGKNINNVSVTAVKYHKYDGTWTSVGTVTDTTETGTHMFSQKGYMSWADPGASNERMVKIGGDDIPWYWYEITVDAALDATTYIYHIKAVPIPDDPDPSYGCFGWKRRAWQIAPRNMENQVRYSAENLIDVWDGIDSGYIEFGERPLRAAGPFYNETVLYADTEIWMLQGNNPSNFGRLRLSANIGIAAPDSLVAVEAGVQVGESIKSVLVWQFYDGFWMFDGVRIMKISSPDIDSFFDPDHDDYINPTYLSYTSGVFDHETQCAMWSVYSGSSATTPTKVIVLHFPSMWYGIFDYGTDVGPMCRVYNNKWYTIAGGHADGKSYLLHSGTTDDVAATATAVDAYVVTRDMFASYSDGLKQKLLSVWAETQTGGGLIEIDEYPDGSDTPQNMYKGNMRWLGKLFGIIQKPLKDWAGQKAVKFRIRNRSKNARMNLLGFSTTVDKGRADE